MQQVILDWTLGLKNSYHSRQIEQWVKSEKNKGCFLGSKGQALPMPSLQHSVNVP